MNTRLSSISKEVSYALRHAPWEYQLELDSEGFVPVEQLLFALNETRKGDEVVSLADLQSIIAQSDKQRHEIVGGNIRALYGHSIADKIKLTPEAPPPILYHGTTHSAAQSILSEGLRPMGRQYVHLSSDVDTALSVGKRRDAHPVILRIDTDEALKDGITFYRGNDKVWLADGIPAQFISIAQ